MSEVCQVYAQTESPWESDCSDGWDQSSDACGPFGTTFGLLHNKLQEKKEKKN